jgi:hypothetical protein
MGVAGAQFLALVRREIDDQQPAARGEQPRRLGHRGRGLLRIMQHLVEDHRVGEPAASGSAYMSPWRSSAAARPASASLTRARRSISGERSTPRACSARGRTIRSSGRCRCRYRPAGRPAALPPGRRAPGRSRPRPRSRRCGASEARPNPWHARRNSARRRRRGRRGPRRAGRRRRSPRVLAVKLGPAVEQAKSGSTRAGSARLRNTQLPSLRRSARPASIRILTWRPRPWAAGSIARSRAPGRELSRPKAPSPPQQAE